VYNMELNNIIIPVIITGLISGVLGLLISIISKIFFIKKDEKTESILHMLPGYNCGACGKAGCMGLAEEIVNNKQSVNKCKPIKQEQKDEIIAFLSKE